MNPCVRSFSAGVLTAILLLPPSLLGATSIDRATITEVVRDVTVIEPASKRQNPAKLQSIFETPNILRTGTESRAEMVAPDQTVTRIGANTLFSFEPNKREINLQKGSILFQSPTGKGGGTIKTAAATASVLGTTLIVVTTKNGGFKVLLLEGKAKIKSPGGDSRFLLSGQMVYAMPGSQLSPVVNFQLKDQVTAAKLVGGFKKTLPSMAKIQAAIAQQQLAIAKGQFIQTGILAGESPDTGYQVDPNAREIRSSEALAQSPFLTAITTDAVINSPSLKGEHLFRISSVPQQFLGFGIENAAPATGDIGLFLARNTTVATPQIDFAPFAGASLFAFVSTEDLILSSSVSLVGAESIPVFFFAGRTILPTAGVRLSASTPELTFFAVGPLVWNDFAIRNATGNISIFGGPLNWTSTRVVSTEGNVTINGGQFDWTGSRVLANTDVNLSGNNFNFDSTQVAAKENVTINATGDVRMIDAQETQTVVAPDGTKSVQSGTGALRALNYSITADGQIVMNRVNFISDNLSVKAGGSQAMNNMLFGPFKSPGSSANLTGSANLSAENLMAINNSNFLIRDIAISGQTVVLRNVSFPGGSFVTLSSASGKLAPNPNTNRPVRPLDVNFISGVTHGGEPAEAQVNDHITIQRR